MFQVELTDVSAFSCLHIDLAITSVGLLLSTWSAFVVNRWQFASVIFAWSFLCKQTPRKLCMLYRTENQFSTTFSNFKHGYTKKFYWSSHIFHWSSHFFISRGPRTDKFRRVCARIETIHPCFALHVLRSFCHFAQAGVSWMRFQYATQQFHRD